MSSSSNDFGEVGVEYDGEREIRRHMIMIIEIFEIEIIRTTNNTLIR